MKQILTPETQYYDRLFHSLTDNKMQLSALYLITRFNFISVAHQPNIRASAVSLG